MKKIITLSFILIVLITQAQKVSDSFQGLIKESPRLQIIQHTDGNLLVYGEMNFFNDAQSSSLIKVDQFGNLVNTFQKVFTDLQIVSAKVLPSGKILIRGGFKYVNGVRTGSLALINADGTLDINFQVAHNTNPFFSAPQSTGKIIVYGYDNGQLFIARLNPDGSRDESFSPAVLAPVIAVGSDDKIYININWKIYRLHSDGSLDNTFSMENIPDVTAHKMVLQSDGKILVSVTKLTYTPTFSMSYSLIRLNSNGSLDNTFHAGDANQSISEIFIRNNGKILITGLFNEFDSQMGNAFELNTNGSISKLLVTTDYNGLYSIYGDNQGNIFITGGFKTVNAIAKEAMVKLKTDYSVDNSFNLPVSRTAGSTPYLPMGYQAGKILIGGNFFQTAVGSNRKKLNRLLSDGSVDLVFNAAIRETTNTRVDALVVQSDNKIVIGGYDLFNSASPFFGRLLPNGAIDNSFQTGIGFRLNGFPITIHAMRVFNNKIYVAGGFDSYNGVLCRHLAILNSDGSFFGPTQMGLPLNSYINDIEIQSTGKIILLGNFPMPNGNTKSVIRLDADGRLDENFDLSITGNIYDIEIDANDKILVAGNKLGLSSELLWRFNSDGSSDNSLNHGIGFEGPFTGYFIKALAGGNIALGGAFSQYQGSSTPGLVVMNDSGEVIPFDNPYDSISFPIAGIYGNNTLFAAGTFSKNRGQEFSSMIKLVFPFNGSIENFTVAPISSSEIDLTWSSPIGAEKLILERTIAASNDFEVIQELTIDQDRFKDKDLDEVTNYSYRIKAVNDGYESDPISGFAKTFLAPAVALNATNVDESGFTANWEYLPGTDSCLLQVSTDNFVTFTPGFENKIVETESLVITGLEYNEYQYRIKRYRNGIESLFSDPILVSVVTDIDENVNFSVYPNPFNNRLSITLPDNIRIATTCSFSSVDGRLVMETSITNGIAEFMDLDKIPSGLYILSVWIDGKVRKAKIIKRPVGR
jgi:uncharacterized delta-60 repeat protein